jgi:hypothetical protein
MAIYVGHHLLYASVIEGSPSLQRAEKGLNRLRRLLGQNCYCEFLNLKKM